MSPVNPNSGTEVLKSFPFDFENSKNSSLTITQLIQYWPLVILSFFQFFLIIRITDYKFENVLFSFRSILKSILVFIIATSLFIIGARGGLQLKPIKVVNAGQIVTKMLQLLNY